MIELMTAVAISGIILGAALGSFRMATRMYQRSEARREALDSCRGALELISQDLVGAFLSSDRSVAFFSGEDLKAGNELDVDSLRLTTLVNNPLRLGGPSSDLAEVEYYVDADPGTPERWLVRRYNPYPRCGMGKGRTALAGLHVAALELLYFSNGEWLTSWQSRTRLPRAVYVMVGAMIDPEGVAEDVNMVYLSNIVWLPYAHG